MIEIKTIEINKKSQIDLLMLADPCEEMIDKYLNKGTMYALYDNKELTCIAVVNEISKEICELKNIATYEHFQNMGYASKMIYHLLDVYSKNIHQWLLVHLKAEFLFMRNLDLFIHIKLKTFL